MKKFFIAAGIACMMCLASCGGVDSKIDKLEGIMTEVSTLAPKAMTGDTEALEKIQKLSVEAQDIANDLKDEDLTYEQKERLTKATLGMLDSLM